MLEYIDRRFLHVSFWWKQAKGRILFVGPFILLNEAIHFLWAFWADWHADISSKALLECQSVFCAFSSPPTHHVTRAWCLSRRDPVTRELQWEFPPSDFLTLGLINDWQKEAKLIRRDRLFQCWVYSQGHLVLMVTRQYSFNSVTGAQPLSSAKRIKIGQHGLYSVQQVVDI